MKFTLTYDGELRANGRPQHKQEIREQLSPQLLELWNVSPALQYVKHERHVPVEGSYGLPVLHHSAPMHDRSFLIKNGKWIDVCIPIDIKGSKFIPLVRDSLSLRCGLKILFLRKEEPGNLIYQGGDIDNRLKTLFDALSVPNNDQMVSNSLNNEPIYCLMEDDRLISGCSIETQRLLSNSNAGRHDVRLIIEVDVRVSLARPYNQPFLGD